MTPPPALSAIATPNAPAAVGPYSQAVACNGLLFVSGQIPLDPATGVFVADDIATSTRRVLDNLSAIAHEAGTDLSRALRLTVYMTDMGDFEQMNKVYAEYFPSHRPARAAVQVAALPKGARIEMDAIIAMTA